MADNTALTLQALIKLSTVEFNRGLQDSKRTFGQFDVMVAKTIADIAKKTAGMLSGLVSTGVTYNAQMQDYVTNFSVMMGSVEAAEAKVEELKKFAASTPFAMDTLSTSLQTLMSFGVSADDASVSMKQLGDIALGDAQKMLSLSTAYGKVASNGKLNAVAMQSMIASGFNPLQTALTAINAGYEKLDITYEDMTNFMSNGKMSYAMRQAVNAATRNVKQLGESATTTDKILAQMGKDGSVSAETLDLIMEYATGEEGMYFNGMLEASKTFNGRLSTLKDNWAALQGEMSKPVSNFLADFVFPNLNDEVLAITDAIKNGGIVAGIKAIPDSFMSVFRKLRDYIYDAVGGKNASTFGKALSVAVAKLVLLFDKFGKNIAVVKNNIGAVFKGIDFTKVLNTINAGLQFLTNNLNIILPVVEAIVGALMISSMLSHLTKIPLVVAKIAGSVTGLFAVINPVVLAITALAAIIANWDNVAGWLKTKFGLELPKWEEIQAGVLAWWNGDNGIAKAITDACTWVLGIFGTPPDGEATQAITAWWSGVSDGVRDACKWVLKIFENPVEAYADVKEKVGGWWKGVQDGATAACNWVLGLFENPYEKGQQVREKVGEWWAKVESFAVAACGWVLGLFGVPTQGEDDVKQTIGKWWEGVKKGAVDACSWVLGIFTNPAQSAEDVKKKVGQWWQKVEQGAIAACTWVLSIFSPPGEDKEKVKGKVTDWWNGVKKGAVEACNWILGLFSEPSADSVTVGKLVDGWWQKVKQGAVDACVWALKLFGNPDANAETVQKQIGEWWTGVVSGAVNACQWVLSLFGKPTEDSEKVKAKVAEWWKGVEQGAINACTWVLQIFGVPTEDSEKVKQKVGTWWTKVKTGAVEACTWVLSLFNNPAQAQSKVEEKVGQWWTKASAWVEGACKWILNLFGVPTDDETTVSKTVGEWWEKVQGYVQSACNWVLSLFGEPTDEETTISGIIGDWWKKVQGFVVNACSWALSLFGQPTQDDEATIQGAISGWWSTVKGFVVNACDWALSIFGIPTETADSAIEQVGLWFDNIAGSVSAACDWVLGLFGEPTDTDSDITDVIDGWWSGVQGLVEGACSWVLGLFGVPNTPDSVAIRTVRNWFDGIKGGITTACSWVLGIFTEPSKTAEDIHKVIDPWWQGVVETVQNACKWVLSLFAEPIDDDATIGDLISAWWGGVVETVQNACKWVLQLFGAPEDPTAADIKNLLSGWWAKVVGYIGNATQWVLQMFGMPEEPAEGWNKFFQDWWNGIFAIVGDIFKLAFSLDFASLAQLATDVAKWASEVAADAGKLLVLILDLILPVDLSKIVEDIGTWWNNVLAQGKKKGEDFLSALMSFTTPSIESIQKQISEWWKSVIAGISLVLGFSTTPYAPKSGTAEGSQYLSDGAEQLDIETKTDLAKLEAYFKEQRGENPQGSHRKGLDYVPYDDYLTYLHKGERVLTNQQAQDYRNGQNNQTYSPTMNIGSINMNRDVDVSAFFAQYDDYVTRKRRGYGWG